MKEVILVINAGSSSLKLSIYTYDDLKLLHNEKIESIKNHDTVVKKWLHNFSNQYAIKVVSHRVVHGGKEFNKPQILSAAIMNKLEALIPLAPLHQPHNLKMINIIYDYDPNLMQIACFDTEFHCSQNHLAKLFAIPQSFANDGLIRYGFHGLSYEYIASVLPDYLGEKAEGKVIVAHLGNGASLCAMHHRKSVATSMGFTALEGLMMGTRCGSIDPGVILYLLQEKKYSPKEVEQLLYEKSGLLGVSEISQDVRTLIKSPSESAKLALDLFCYKAAKEIGGLITTLKGCDAIVFTAGIGENSPLIREKIGEWFNWLGLKISNDKNKKNDTLISDKESNILVLVIPTNEELMLAKHAVFLTKHK